MAKPTGASLSPRKISRQRSQKHQGITSSQAENRSDWPKHWKRPTEKEFVALLKRHGFKKVRASKSNSGRATRWKPMTVAEFEAIMKKHGGIPMTPEESKRYRKILRPRA